MNYSRKSINMKRVHYLAIAFLMLCLSSCSVIAGIFKAGVAVGIIAIVIVIVIIIWIASLFRK
jgi:hypothetical protein